MAETPREILTTGSEVKINSAPDLGDLKTCTDNANLPPLPPVWVLQHCCEFCYQVMKVTTALPDSEFIMVIPMEFAYVSESMS